MRNMLETKIKEHDKFHHVPAFTVGFNGKMKYTTIPGGLHSIFIFVFTIIVWFSELKGMMNYKGVHINYVNTHDDLTEIG